MEKREEDAQVKKLEQAVGSEKPGEDPAPHPVAIDLGLSGGVLADDFDAKKIRRKKKKKAPKNPEAEDSVPTIGLMNASAAPLPVSVGLFTGISLPQAEEKPNIFTDLEVDALEEPGVLRAHLRTAQSKILDLLKENEELRTKAEQMRREIRGLELVIDTRDTRLQQLEKQLHEAHEQAEAQVGPVAARPAPAPAPAPAPESPVPEAAPAPAAAPAPRFASHRMSLAANAISRLDIRAMMAAVTSGAAGGEEDDEDEDETAPPASMAPPPFRPKVVPSIANFTTSAPPTSAPPARPAPTPAAAPAPEKSEKSERAAPAPAHPAPAPVAAVSAPATGSLGVPRPVVAKPRPSPVPAPVPAPAAHAHAAKTPSPPPAAAPAPAPAPAPKPHPVASPAPTPSPSPKPATPAATAKPVVSPAKPASTPTSAGAGAAVMGLVAPAAAGKRYVSYEALKSVNSANYMEGVDLANKEDSLEPSEFARIFGMPYQHSFLRFCSADLMAFDWAPIASIFILIAIGYLMRVINRLDMAAGKPLSSMVVNLTLPGVILVKMISTAFPSNLIVFPFLAFFYDLFQMLGALLAFKIMRRKWPQTWSEDMKPPFLICCTSHNIGLFAYPIFEALYGDTSVFCMALWDLGNSVYIFIIAYGMCYYYRAPEKRDPKPAPPALPGAVELTPVPPAQLLIASAKDARPAAPSNPDACPVAPSSTDCKSDVATCSQATATGPQDHPEDAVVALTPPEPAVLSACIKSPSPPTLDGAPPMMVAAGGSQSDVPPSADVACVQSAPDTPPEAEPKTNGHDDTPCPASNEPGPEDEGPEDEGPEDEDKPGAPSVVVPTPPPTAAPAEPPPAAGLVRRQQTTSSSAPSPNPTPSPAPSVPAAATPGKPPAPRWVALCKKIGSMIPIPVIAYVVVISLNLSGVRAFPEPLRTVFGYFASSNTPLGLVLLGLYLQFWPSFPPRYKWLIIFELLYRYIPGFIFGIGLTALLQFGLGFDRITAIALGSCVLLPLPVTNVAFINEWGLDPQLPGVVCNLTVICSLVAVFVMYGVYYAFGG
ncbi:hypothetical protein PAPYR_3954 [Paratrimastix pyriformis]|uniref:Uncharacterized protein n=1 Tax=Paratrimastix pyriformis TaxID=342808 RepID=A0ABQ8UL15_9EUKA|nr:hypothetical protein PAPYR_3954 [Paratrimastix pyriformis]